MASGAKISKTARASIGKDKDTIEAGKPCPQCKTPMVATRVIKSAGMPGGMYWVCPKDDYRLKTQGTEVWSTIFSTESMMLFNSLRRSMETASGTAAHPAASRPKIVSYP